MDRARIPVDLHRSQGHSVISRRRFIGLATTATFASLLAACGGSAQSPGATTTTQMQPTEIPGSGETTTPIGPTGATPTLSSASDEPRQGGTLIYARNIDAKTLDPHFSAQWSERFMLYCIFNTLVSWDAEFNITPELARSWDVASDGRSITFHLASNVRFHDGTPCDADAVRWNLQRVLDPNVNSPLRGQLEPAIEQIEVIDEATLRVELKKPWRPLLAALGERPGFIVSPAAVENYGEDFGRNPVGSGPFKFVEWSPDSHITVERFPDYWDSGKPYLDRIEMRHVPDIQVRLTMVRTGEAHIIDEVDPSVVDMLRGEPDIVVEEFESWRWYATQCDVDKPPFDNADFRKALAYATDRETIRQVIFGGTGRAITHPIVGGWAYDTSLDELMQFDLATAKKHLDQAGVAGQTFTLTASNNRLIQDLAQLLQAQYQELGITVEIETVDSSESFALVKEDKTNWTLTNWTPRADPDGLLRILWHSQGFQNTTGFSNPDVDRLLDEAAGIYDTKQAADLYHQVEKIITEDAHYVFIHAPAEFAVMRKEVGGFEYSPDLVLRLRNLWLRQPS